MKAPGTPNTNIFPLAQREGRLMPLAGVSSYSLFSGSLSPTCVILTDLIDAIKNNTYRYHKILTDLISYIKGMCYQNVSSYSFALGRRSPTCVQNKT